MRKAIGLCVLAAATVFGQNQNIDLSAWDKFASKAKESSVVTLTPETLGLATSVLTDDSGDGKQLKDVIAKLKGVTIRTYEFAEKGAYTKADVEAVRKQLGGPGWTKFMEVKDGEEQVEMWLHKSANGSGGLTILAAEPRQLTFVQIDGPPDLASLMRASKLLKGGGLDGVLSDKGSPSKKKSPRDEDNEEDN